MSYILVLVGESSSGKTTLAKALEEQLDMKRIVTYTTRPRRIGEVNGVDYHFVDDKEFEKMVSKEMFLETGLYRGWKYGTLKADLKLKDGIAVLTPPGLRAVQKAKIPHVSIYLMTDRASRLISCIQRGDNIDEAYRRNLSDVGMFAGVEHEVDYVIFNDQYRIDIDTLVKIVKNILEDDDQIRGAEQIEDHKTRFIGS